jgi:hypothetical protein
MRFFAESGIISLIAVCVSFGELFELVDGVKEAPMHQMKNPIIRAGFRVFVVMVFYLIAYVKELAETV